MSRLRQLHAENVVLLPLLDPRKGDLPMSRLHAERIFILPLIAGVIAGIICLAGALNRVPGGAPAAADHHAGPPVSEDHQPLRGPG